MELEIKDDCLDTDWTLVAAILKSVGMAYTDPEIHKKAFEASHTTIFVYHDQQLIGFGRAISDGVYQAAVYDVAVLPDVQGKRVGTLIMRQILQRVAGCTVILYASPGKEIFYQKLGLRRMKTGMALFAKAEDIAEKGFTE